MKVWDMVYMARNIRERIITMRGGIGQHLSSILTDMHGQHPNIQHQTRTAWDKLCELVDLASLLAGAAANEFPLYGIKPWMMAGNEPTLVHAYSVMHQRQTFTTTLAHHVGGSIDEAVQIIMQAMEDMHELKQADGADAAYLKKSIDVRLSRALNAAQDARCASFELERLMHGIDVSAIQWNEMGLGHLVPQILKRPPPEPAAPAASHAPRAQPDHEPVPEQPPAEVSPEEARRQEARAAKRAVYEQRKQARAEAAEAKHQARLAKVAAKRKAKEP